MRPRLRWARASSFSGRRASAVPTFPVKHGGMYRCCVQVASAADPEVLPSIVCPYCQAVLTWDGQAWEWLAVNQPASAAS
jgi:hypothetical protein